LERGISNPLDLPAVSRTPRLRVERSRLQVVEARSQIDLALTQLISLVSKRAV